MDLNYYQKQPNALVSKKYNNNIPLVSETTEMIERLYGSDSKVFWTLPLNVPIMDRNRGIVMIAIDLSTTGVTAAYKTTGNIPKPIDRFSQNMILTPVKDKDVKKTIGLWDDDFKSLKADYTTPSVVRMNDETSDTNTNHSAAVQTFTVFDKTILPQTLIQTDGGSDPLQENHIIDCPKQILSSLPENSPDYPVYYKALVGLAREAIIRSVRSFPDKRHDDFQFICTYASTNDSYSLQALREAIAEANDTLGDGFLRENENVTFIPEHLAARSYYLANGLPDGSHPGKHFCTADIGSFSTDVSLTLDDRIVKAFSLPYAGHTITTDSWKQMCLYDLRKAKAVFHTNNDKYGMMLVDQASEFVRKLQKLADDPNQPLNNGAIVESRTLDAYWELLSDYINQKKIDSRLFTLLCRTKLSALLQVLEQEIKKSLRSASIRQGEQLNIVFLGRGSYVFHNLKNANSELLNAWEKRITSTFGIPVKVQIANSTQKIQLVHGMLSFPLGANSRPNVPASIEADSDDRYNHYKNSIGTEEAEQLFKYAVNISTWNFGETVQARKLLSTRMFEKIHEEYSYDDFCTDLASCYIPEAGPNPDNYVSRSGTVRYLTARLSDRALFDSAKMIMGTKTYEDIRRYVLSATGMEKELYFLKMLELAVKISMTG